MNFIKHFDQYASRIEVNLKGRTTQKSSCGGIISIITFIIVLIYTGFLAKRLILRE